MLKLDRLLSDPHRAEFNELVARPGTRIEDAFQWLTGRGYAVGRAAVAAYLRRQRPQHRAPHRFSRMEKLLKRKDMRQVEIMASDPSKTVDDVYLFVQSRGYPISRVVVWRFLHRWRDEVKEIQRCSRFARSLAEVAEDAGPSRFAAGATLGFEQVILEHVFELRKEEKLSAKELTEWAGTLERALTLRRQIEDFRKASAPAEGGAAAEAADTQTCVQRMEDILGA
jgi:hypothetical protein